MTQENKKDFAWGVGEAARMTEFVEYYNRLTGNNFKINPPKSPLDQMVDGATGYQRFDENEARKFAVFFYEFIWSRIPSSFFEPIDNGEQE